MTAQKRKKVSITVIIIIIIAVVIFIIISEYLYRIISICRSIYKSKTVLNAAGGMEKNTIYFKSHKTKGIKETEKIKNKLRHRYWQNHRQMKKKSKKS